MAEVDKKWWYLESYGTLIVADQRSKEDKLADKILNSKVKFNGERYEVGILWNGKQEDLSTNYSSALGQLKSLQRRLNSDKQLLDKYIATIHSDLTKGKISILSSEELKSSNQGVWYVPRHSVLNSNKPDNVRSLQHR